MWKTFGKDELKLDELVFVRAFRIRDKKKICEYFLAVFRKPAKFSPKIYREDYFEMRVGQNLDWLKIPDNFDWLEIPSEIPLEN